jgi:hypothetical protein
MFPAPSAGQQHSRAAPKPAQRLTALPSRTRTAPSQQQLPAATPVAAALQLRPTATTSPQQVAVQPLAAARMDALIHV